MSSLPSLLAPESPTLPVLITLNSGRPWAGHPGALLWLTLTLAMAALLVLPDVLTPVLAPLPAYAVTLRSEAACSLCGVTAAPTAAAAQTLHPDLPIELLARPLAAVRGPAFLHLYVRQGRQQRRVFSFAAQRSDGSLQLAGLAREVLDLRGDERGRLELLVVVSRSPLPFAPLPWLPAWPARQAAGAPIVLRLNDL